jgi:hypothetical protein
MEEFKFKLDLLYSKISKEYVKEKEMLQLFFIEDLLNKYIRKAATQQKYNIKVDNKYKNFRKCAEDYCSNYISNTDEKWKIRCKHCYFKQKKIKNKPIKEECIACNGTMVSYWSEGEYGDCILCTL